MSYWTASLQVIMRLMLPTREEPQEFTTDVTRYVGQSHTFDDFES